MYEIKNVGVKLYASGFFSFDIVKLSELFEALYQNYRSDCYPNVASLQESQFAGFDCLQNIYQKICSEFSIDSSRYVLDKLWCVKTFHENVDVNELPYVPHIDKRRYVKVMIYVDSVGKNDGPFHAFSCRPEQNEPMRRSLGLNYKVKQENRVKSISVDRYKQFVGPAGSVLVFDTNCPHFAGQVEEGCKRRVLRFDFEDRSENKLSLFDRVKNIVSF